MATCVGGIRRPAVWRTEGSARAEWRPSVGRTARSETLAERGTAGTAGETFGRADGGVGDPRRTGDGADGGETFGLADGGVGDPRRTGGGADGGVGDPRRTGDGADGGVGDPRRSRAARALSSLEGEWNVATIRERFRAAVDSFAPDYVVISDTWNMKPHLAEAMRGYPYYLLMQAQECLCPLNNLRLLGIGPTKVEQCPRNQLATPQVCHQCLAERGHHAGALHQHERALAGVGTAEYDRILRQSFYDAEAVLVLNPITAALLEPYARRVCIVPWGIDPARFPWRVDEMDSDLQGDGSSPPCHGERCRPLRDSGRRKGNVGRRSGSRRLHAGLRDLAPLGLCRLRMWSGGLGDRVARTQQRS